MYSGSIFYGSEESVGSHVILSNLFWWMSLILVIAAYRNRRIWNVGNTPWIFLFFTFFFFGLREIGHFYESDIISSFRYTSGIFSAIFLTSALILIHRKIYSRKTYSKTSIIVPFIIAVLFPVYLIYLYSSGEDFKNIKSVFSIIENIVWMTGGSIMVYMTYMLGTKSTGDFVHIYMFFLFAAIFAITWKLTGFISVISCEVPYSIRELLETMFGVCAVISMYILEKMLRTLSKRIS